MTRVKWTGLSGSVARASATLILTFVLNLLPQLVLAQAGTGAAPAAVGAAGNALESPSTPVPIEGEGAAVPISGAEISQGFTWAAEKKADGTVLLSGKVPSDVVRQAIRSTAGVSDDEMVVGGGAPVGFQSAAVAGLKVLAELAEGRVAFASGRWELTGTAQTPVNAFLAERVFDNAGLDGTRWTYSVSVAAAETAPEPAVANPYVWSAAKAPDGAIRFSGFVPSESFRRVVAVRVDNSGGDRTEIAAGEPDGFVADALAGLDALAALESGEVAFDGSTWTLSGTPIPEADRQMVVAALSAAATPSEDWDIQIAEPPRPEPPDPVAVPEPAQPSVDPVPQTEPSIDPKVEPEPATELASSSYRFQATRADGGPIALSGDVPAEAARSYFGVIAGNVPTSSLSITQGPPRGYLDSAIAGLRALAMLRSGELTFDGAKWSLAGKAKSAETLAAAQRLIAALPEGEAWSTGLVGPSPLEVCQLQVADFTARNEILFQSGSAEMAPASVAALDELAADLSACPEATIEVEGHTDADGPEDDNMALSVSRAEAVVNGLAARGIAPERLYAIGYGETLPIAPNDTVAGKRSNRRIVFNLLEGTRT